MANVDAYNESEQTVGFLTMIEDNLAMPFQTEVLGVEVTVERIDMNDDGQIVALCSRGTSRQRIPILDLPLPTTMDQGREVICFADEGGSWQVGVTTPRDAPGCSR